MSYVFSVVLVMDPREEGEIIVEQHAQGEMVVLLRKMLTFGSGFELANQVAYGNDVCNSRLN
jgi:hypothetical protein